MDLASKYKGLKLQCNSNTFLVPLCYKSKYLEVYCWLTNIRPCMEENSMTLVCMIHGQISS